MAGTATEITLLVVRRQPQSRITQGSPSANRMSKLASSSMKILSQSPFSMEVEGIRK